MKKSLLLLTTALCISTAAYGVSRQEIIDNPLFETSESRWKVMDDDYAVIKGIKTSAFLELIKDKNGCHIDFLSGVKYEKPLDKYYDFIFTTKRNGYAATVKHDFHQLGGPSSEEYRHSLDADAMSPQGRKTLVGLLKRSARDDISSTVRVSYGISKATVGSGNQYYLDNQLYTFSEFSLYYFVEVADKLGCD